MQLKPPKKWRSADASDFARFIGRVHEVHPDLWVLTIWEWFGERKGYGKKFFANVTLDPPAVTHTGRARLGSVVELWTWNENYGCRTHMRALP